MRTRKTRVIWDVQGDYGRGWETVTAEERFHEARERIREYRENEPGVAFRLKVTRERIEVQP